MKAKFVRRAVTAGTVLVMVATAAAGAYATVLDPVATRQGSLTSFGPLMDNGFPTSYKDSNAVRLEACYTADPLCPGANIPDTSAPIVFPTNFPDEFFYQLASATLTVATHKLLVETNLEASFANGTRTPGDQITFARVRIKDVDVPDGVTWRITHPYGVDEFTAGANGKAGINVTQDVGVSAGSFGGALNSRLGPFLKWDPSVLPAAPKGYIGDPGVLHSVVGSPYGTNFIKVEQKNADGSYSPVAGGDLNQFTLQGRYAVNSGVDIDAANFTTSGGNSFLDVYASSDAGQAIQVSANAALHTDTIPMRETAGRYYAHIPVTGQVPPDTTIEVVNAGDNPPAKKTATLVDQPLVTSATYNADTQALTVSATSSDGETGANAPALSVAGFGPLTNGTATFTAVNAPPATVKVVSTRGGSESSPITATGAGFTASAPVAFFTAPANAQVGQPVPLDGTASTGDIANYAWSTSDGTVTTTTLGHAIWTPSASGAATISLTVSGPGGVSLPTTNTVTVAEAAAVGANAGPDQTVTRGGSVTLDGSATTGQQSLTWTQVSGPTVTLSNATAAKPTFSYPLMKLPVGPAAHLNNGYAVANAPLVFQLSATPVGGGTPITDQVTINPTTEAFTGLTARYRTRGEWRVTGTSSIKAGQTVAMVLGSNGTGPFIGQATADAAGAFSFKGALQPVPGGGQTTVTYISATGGTAIGTLLVTP
jgi:hypothetical protein